MNLKKYRKFLGLFLFAVIVCIAHPAIIQAQLTRGSVAGTVRDSNGAVVAGAVVKITNIGTNISREVTTSDDGFYRVSALDPGTYAVSIEKSGFKKLENKGVPVNIATETAYDAELTIGDVSASIDVTADAEAISLNKTNGTVGAIFTERQAETLPLGAARSIENLALLSPNVFSAPGSSGISANGQRARNNNFTIDGSDNNDISVTIRTTPIIPEAVGEFQIQTNPYSVEFGRNSGAQININTKGGTNKFHGDVFEYYRGSGLNAVDNIEKANGLRQPSRFNRNQFGFGVGGPIIKDKTFFFYLFQLDRTNTGQGLGGNVRIPTQAGLTALNSVPLRTGQSAASRQAVLGRLGFLSNVISQGVTFRSVNTSQIVNGVAIETGLTNVPIVQNSESYNNTLRIDHRLTSNDNITGRYISNKPTDLNAVSNTGFGSIFAGDQAIFDQNLSLSETHIFNSRVINEFRVSYIRRNLQFPERAPNEPTAGITGLFSIGGAANFPQGRVQNSFQYSDTLSMEAGNHRLKFGLDIRRIQLKNIAAFDSKGTFTFNNLQDYVNNFAINYAQALQTADFAARQTQQFYFVQDDWRVSPSLNLSFGLRYETSNNPFGFFGATDPQSLGALVPGPTRRDKNNFAPAFGFAYSPRLKGDGLFAKFFGEGKSSIRGGYRISYDLLFFNILTVNASNFPRVVVLQTPNATDVYPNRIQSTGAATFNPLATYVNTPQNAETPYSQLYSLSMQREIGRDYLLEVGYTGSRSLNQINQLQGNPGILTAAQIATVVAMRNAGAIPNLQARRQLPQFGSRVLIDTSAQGTYNAGYASLNKRFSNGLQFGVAYTFSKLMSNNDESLGVGAITGGSPQIPQDFFNIKPEKSVSAFDRTHRLAANFIYALPLPPGGFFRNTVMKQVFGGWELSGIIQRQSGQPFTILTGVDSNGNGGGGDRPNFDPNGSFLFDPVTGDLRSFTSPVVGGRFIVPLGTNNLPLANSLGNGGIGRNTFRAPGFYNTDVSITKGFKAPWAESHRGIFRFDFLNAFNQDSYGRPVNTLSSADFGRNLNNFGNRSMTLSFKYSF